MKNDFDMTIEEFTGELASASPAPGGGGAAALAGAIGASLCSMAAGLTIGKKKYAASEDEMKGIVSSCEGLRGRFLALIDRDAECFLPLAEAYSIPQDDPDREEKLFRASMSACSAALEMIDCCCSTADLLEKVLKSGSRMLISDVGCGALSIRTALESAALNVFVNTKAYRGREEADEIEARVRNALDQYLKKAEAISSEVMRQLQGDANG